jgi:hypothetical protein
VAVANRQQIDTAKKVLFSLGESVPFLDNLDPIALLPKVRHRSR